MLDIATKASCIEDPKEISIGQADLKLEVKAHSLQSELPALQVVSEDR